MNNTKRVDIFNIQPSNDVDDRVRRFREKIRSNMPTNEHEDTLTKAGSTTSAINNGSSKWLVFDNFKPESNRQPRVLYY